MALPPGLALNPVTGQIAGTPTTPGVYNFTLRVRDAQGLQRDLPRTIQILDYTPPSMSGTLAQFSNRGVAYSSGFAVAGGSPPYAWSVSVGTLPTGITLNAATGAISGTPTDTSFVDRDITIRVVDAVGSPAQRSGTIRYADTLALSGTLGTGIQGTPYSSGFTRTGGHSPFTFALHAGTLPAGLTLNSSTGVISGTPTTVTSNAITVRVTDASGAFADRSQTLTINSSYVPLSFSGSITGAVQDVQTLSAFSISPSYGGVTLSGGTTPVTFSWARLSGSTAIDAGSPSTFATTFVGNVAPGSSVSATFRCTASDGTSSATIDVAVQVTNTYQTLGLSMNLGRATRLAAYSSQPSRTGGIAPYTFVVAAGTLPAGITINSSTGLISGTPSDGSFTDRAITVRVTDGLGAFVDASSTMIYRDSPGFSYVLPAAMRTRAYSASPTLSPNGHGFGSMAITSGALPAGIALSASNGALSGTPTDTTFGQRTLNFQFTDASGAVAAQTGVTMAYAENLALAGAFPAGTAGVAYSSTAVTATGGHGGNVWTVAAGSLPPGLALNGTTGALTGTPTMAGSYSFTVRVTDGAGFNADSAQNMSIGAALAASVAPTSAAILFVNNPASNSPASRVLTTNSVTASATGGTAPYVFSWTHIAGSTAVTADTPSDAITTFTATVNINTQLDATFRVTVTDAALSTTTVDVPVTLRYDSGF